MTEHDEILVVDDLMLMLLGDAGNYIAGAGTLHYSLGGALLVDLALRGLVEVGEEAGINGPEVRVVKGEPPADPLLRSAWEKVAERPRRVQPLLLELGAGLYAPVLERLAERGFVRRERKRRLGLFTTTRWPVADGAHEAELRRRIVAVLDTGTDPEVRTAAVIALLSASGTLPMLQPPLPWSGDVYTRAKEIEGGSWGAEAVSTAVLRNAAAVSVASAVSLAAVTSTTGR